MPREGVFTEVIEPGHIKIGDEITMIPPKKDRPFTAAVITLSDKGAAGEREDKSGPKIVEMIKEAGYDVKETLLLPDGRTALEKQLIRLANGIADAIRNYSMTITPRAMFSRAVSGIRKRTLIINLPGSPKAVQEALEFLLPNLGHGIGILRGSEGECAR